MSERESEKERESETERVLLFELPILPAHGALLIHLLTVEPLHDAMYMEAVGALAPDERTVVTGKFTVGTATVEGHAANAAVIVISDPFPHRHTSPVLYFHFHDGVFKLFIFFYSVLCLFWVPVRLFFFVPTTVLLGFRWKKDPMDVRIKK